MLFPAPLAPTIATISPRAHLEATPSSTVDAPAVAAGERLREIPRLDARSFVPDRLDRVEPRRLRRRIDRGQHGDRHARQHDQRDVEQLEAHRQVVDEIYLRIEAR